ETEVPLQASRLPTSWLTTASAAWNVLPPSVPDTELLTETEPPPHPIATTAHMQRKVWLCIPSGLRQPPRSHDRRATTRKVGYNGAPWTSSTTQPGSRPRASSFSRRLR